MKTWTFYYERLMGRQKPKEVVDALRGFKQVTNFHISEYLVNGGMYKSRY